MRRRSLLIGGAGLLAGTGAVTGTSAFSTSATYGTVGVDVDSGPIEIQDPQGNEPTNDIDLDGTAQRRRVNVAPEVVRLKHTGDSPQQVSAAFVDEGGADITDLATALDDGVIDVRLFAVSSGTVTYVDSLSARDSLRDRDDTALDNDQYLDNDRTARRVLPDVDGTLGDDHGSITLEDGDAAMLGDVVTLGDVEEVQLPDVRVDIP